MKWSPQQDAALKYVANWLADPTGPQVCRLSGYAGTGKTTLAMHFASDLPGTVLFGAFTGKAAHVMRQKGCPGATTIHRLIYISREKSRLRLAELEAKYTEELTTAEETALREAIKAERKRLAQPIFEKNRESEVRTAQLVIIDEGSLVDGRMGEDLMSFGTKILVLGDPAQLPPVYGAGFFTSDKPEILLTEIHRQARDNPIIDMATTIREGGRLKLGDYGSSRVVARTDADEVMAADQVLVGRNTTRHAHNRRMRELRGTTVPYPIIGDKLCCWRNNHDIGLMNGSIWYVGGVGDHDDERVTMDIYPENAPVDSIQTVQAHACLLYGKEEDMPWWERKEAEEFQWGYALTCHKSQGSQWDNVMVFDESYCFRQNKSKWLYTAVTRAAEKVTVVNS